MYNGNLQNQGQIVTPTPHLSEELSRHPSILKENSINMFLLFKTK